MSLRVVLAVLVCACVGACEGASVARATAHSRQIPSLGFCPDYVPVTDFDMNRFLGRWYEVERYFTVSEVASRCVSIEFTKKPSGKIYVSNEITNRLTSVKRVVDGSIEYAGRVGEGSITIRYNAFPPSDTNYKILDTDYSTYAVLWSCSGIGPVNTQNAWVYTRDRNPSVAALQRAYGVLDKFKISRAFFLKTDQKDCQFGEEAETSAASSTLANTAQNPIQEEAADTKKVENTKTEHTDEETPDTEVVNDQPVKVIPVQVVNLPVVGQQDKDNDNVVSS